VDKQTEALEISAEKRLETERMHDTLILLQNLTNDQEETIKLILDCLYDVAAVNLINQKLRSRPLNRVTKLIARMSKPMLKVFAWQWVKKNCPQLIANWLHLQVSFSNSNILANKVAVEVIENHPHLPERIDNLSHENQFLRYQVRCLAGISALALTTVGVTVSGLYLNSEALPLQSRQQIQLRKNFPIGKSSCDQEIANHPK
jgi:hypothetical protein